MAGFKLDLDKEISFGKGASGNYPTKTSINLVPPKKGLLTTRKGVLEVILAALVILMLVIFLVIRPLVQMTSAKAQVKDLQSRIDDANKTIESMHDIEEEYAHYTTEGMTDEEQSRIDRISVMRLVEKAEAAGGSFRSWTVSGNVMTLQVDGSSLSGLNQVAAALEREPIVERCVINTADKGRNHDTGDVEVSFIVYLMTPADGQQAEAPAPAENNNADQTEEEAE